MKQYKLCTSSISQIVQLSHEQHNKTLTMKLSLFSFLRAVVAMKVSGCEELLLGTLPGVVPTRTKTSLVNLFSRHTCLDKSRTCGNACHESVHSQTHNFSTQHSTADNRHSTDLFDCLSSLIGLPVLPLSSYPLPRRHPLTLSGFCNSSLRHSIDEQPSRSVNNNEKRR